jgi:hypothetical protein
MKRLVRERTKKVEIADNRPWFRTWWQFQWVTQGFEKFWEVKKSRNPC